MTDPKDFWYPRKPENLLSATRGWPWQLAAFYALFLDVIYHKGGAVEDDLDAVRTWVGIDLTPKTWATMRDQLIDLGKLTRAADGTLHNPVADEHFAKRSAEKNKNTPEKTGNFDAKTGQKHVEKPVRFTPPVDGKKASKNNKTPPQMGLDLEVSPRARADSLESESRDRLGPEAVTVIDQVERIAEVLGQKRGRYWEADFTRLLKSEDLTFEDVLEAARAHKAKSGELLRSMNGLKGLARAKRADRIERGHAPAPVEANDGPLDPDQWKTALVKLALRGVWAGSRLGPMPGVEGYRGPHDLAVDFLQQWKAQGEHPLEELDLSDNFVPYPAERPDPERRARWKEIRT